MRTMIVRALPLIVFIGTIFGLVAWNHSQSPGKDAGTLFSSEDRVSVQSGAPVFARGPTISEMNPGHSQIGEANKVLGPAPNFFKHKTLEAYAYREQIESFRVLGKKVFLSDEERRTKRELLESNEFLESLAGLLKVGSGESLEMKQAQNAALDILFESLRADRASVATEVLAEIVTDGQIENEALDMVTKRDLAGVKAEVLYYWSSLDPSSSSRIEQSLPGPVSRRIWENVISVQQNNLEESTLEASRYPAGAEAL